MQIPMGWRICMLSVVIFACLSGGRVAVSQSAARQPLVGSLPDLLKSQIEAVGRTPGMSIRREILGAPDGLVRFYEDRGFRPLWLGNDGPLPQVDRLLQVIRQAEREGIKPIGYHLSCIAQLLAETGWHNAHEQPQSLRAWVDLELLLTDALFMYGSHALT